MGNTAPDIHFRLVSLSDIQGKRLGPEPWVPGLWCPPNPNRILRTPYSSKSPAPQSPFPSVPPCARLGEVTVLQHLTNLTSSCYTGKSCCACGSLTYYMFYIICCTVWSKGFSIINPSHLCLALRVFTYPWNNFLHKFICTQLMHAYQEPLPHYTSLGVNGIIIRSKSDVYIPCT